MRHQKSFIEDFNHTYFEQLPLWDFTVIKYKFLIVKQLKYLAFCCNYLQVHHLYLWTIGFLFVCLLVFFLFFFFFWLFFFYNKLLLTVCDELQLWAKRLKELLLLFFFYSRRLSYCPSRRSHSLYGHVWAEEINPRRSEWSSSLFYSQWQEDNHPRQWRGWEDCLSPIFISLYKHDWRVQRVSQGEFLCPRSLLSWSFFMYALLTTYAQNVQKIK